MRTSWQITHDTVHRTSYQIRTIIIIVLITALSSSGRDVYTSLTPITGSYDRSSQVVWQDWYTPVYNCLSRNTDGVLYECKWQRMGQNISYDLLRRENLHRSHEVVSRHDILPDSNAFQIFYLAEICLHDCNPILSTRLKLWSFWVCSRSAHGLRKYCLYWNAYV
jgi:hypothetical protein